MAAEQAAVLNIFYHIHYMKDIGPMKRLIDDE